MMGLICKISHPAFRTPSHPRNRRKGALAALARLAPLLFLLASCALFPDASRATPPEHSQAPVYLGINYPLTGPYSVEGLDQIRAARMAVDEINAAGGVLGRPATLLSRDSASDVLLTRINVKEMIDAGAGMIFGGSSSAVAIAASEVCTRHNVIFFATLAYSTSVTLENASRTTFRECNDSWMAASVMADWLNANFAGKRYMYITADYTWGWTTEESLREVTGTVNRQTSPGLLMPLGSTNFHKALEQAAAFKPDVLVLVLFGKDLAYALRQANEMGLNKTCQIVAPNLTIGMAERAGAKAMEGVVGALPWSWNIPSLFDYPRGKAFVEAFTQRYRRYPSTSAASAYAIVLQYKDAVERAGSLKTADVVRALEGHSYRLLKDEQTWRALDHQNIQTVFMVRGNPTAKVLADPLRMDFFEIIGGMPGDKITRSEEAWKKLRQAVGLRPYLEPLRE